jgi:hypothetical protein
MPQLALQHSMPVSHVARPQVTLKGTVMALSHGVWSHDSPDRTQVPHVALQHTYPRLHVLIPHIALWANAAGLQSRWEHSCPGAVQMPQLALQQT